MNKKLLSLLFLIVLLLMVVGAASAMPPPGDRIYIQPDTNLDVACRDGVIAAQVDNSGQTAVVHIACYTFLPPKPEN